MEKFARYLAAFDGSSTWEDVQPLFEDAFHPACVFVTADGELNKNEWAEMARGLAEKGAVASDFEVSAADGDTIFYKLTIQIGDEDPLRLAAKGTLEGDQLIRVEPFDPSAYSTMVERSA